MIEITQVKTKSQIKMFATYPLKLYKGCPYYVPAMLSDEYDLFNKKKNPSIEKDLFRGFLCFKDGELVGRIAGLINEKDNELTGKKFIRFSRFECIDDIEVFKALIGAVEQFGKEKGMEIIHGPWGFNDTDREGMLTFGFEERSTYATTYSYPYFCQRMVELGFLDESKWIEKRFVIPSEVPERIVRISQKLKEKYKLIDVADKMSVPQILSKYGDKFFETMTDAYQHLDGYVPIEGQARKNMLKQFATIVNNDYISILIDEKGSVAAFGIVLPSIADAMIKHGGKLFPLGFISVLDSILNPDDLEMALVGVKSEYKNSGINAIIITRIMTNIIKNKVKNIESNPMLEHNLEIQQMWKFADGEIVKRRQTYKKDID